MRFENVQAALRAGEDLAREFTEALRERPLLYGWHDLSEKDLLEVTERVGRNLSGRAMKRLALEIDAASERARQPPEPVTPQK